MDVLNTYGGGVDAHFVILAIICGLLTLLAISAAIGTDDFALLLLGVVLGVVTIFLATNAREPIRHEVILRPGYVIDAAKYEIIEQRGQIYVIEEREEAQQ